LRTLHASIPLLRWRLSNPHLRMHSGSAGTISATLAGSASSASQTGHETRMLGQFGRRILPVFETTGHRVRTQGFLTTPSVSHVTHSCSDDPGVNDSSENCQHNKWIASFRSTSRLMLCSCFFAYLAICVLDGSRKTLTLPKRSFESRRHVTRHTSTTES
jgi:hypothetical protein